MFNRAMRLTAIVKAVDKALYAKRNGEMLQIWRKSHGVDPSHGKTVDNFVLALTDSWTISGKSVDWGIEPLMKKLREMDAWTRVTLYEEFVKERETKLKDKERLRHNEFHAATLDAYRDRRFLTN